MSKKSRFKKQIVNYFLVKIKQKTTAYAKKKILLTNL